MIYEANGNEVASSQRNAALVIPPTFPYNCKYKEKGGITEEENHTFDPRMWLLQRHGMNVTP